MVLVLKERGVGFKGTEASFKTKFILLAIHCNFIYFQGILFLFHLISPTVYKYHIIQQTITSPNKKTKDHRQNEQNNSQTVSHDAAQIGWNSAGDRWNYERVIISESKGWKIIIRTFYAFRISIKLLQLQ